MTAYLFTWNPKRWFWPDFSEYQRHIREEGFVIEPWRCASKRIRVGDRAFLMRLGEEPKGIFGSGVVVREPYADRHYDPVRADAGDVAWYVDIRFDILRNPQRDDILPHDRLTQDPMRREMRWTPQGSGVSIREAVVGPLERAWAEITGDEESLPLPEEIDSTVLLVEGAKQRIWVNRYERDAEARRQCIAHYGARCFVCGFDFGATYGSVGVGFIHVHHLLPLSEIGTAYEVDPVADLRPVCPNCHGIIHCRRPPYDLEEVRKFLTVGDES